MNRAPTDIGKFCNNLEKFFSNLEQAYPDDPDLPYYKDKIMAFRQINARAIVEQFMEFAQDYINPIMSKDASFFLDLEVNGLVTDNSYSKLIEKIQNLWATMSEPSRDQVFKYFQVFVTLGIKVTKRADLLPTINQYREIPLTI